MIPRAQVQLENGARIRSSPARHPALAVLALLLFLIWAGPASAGVSIPNRPFGIDPETLHQYTDGFFDVVLGVQSIGVFLQNDGTDAITNVVVLADFEPGSGIFMLENMAYVPLLPPGVPTLLMFRADFSASRPNKWALTLNVTGDSFNQVVARNVFVTRTEFDPTIPNRHTMYAPEGRIIVDMGMPYSGPGASLANITAPESFHWTVEHTPPFVGQFGPLPYADPWWKAFGLGFGLAGCAGWAVGAVAEKCGADWGSTVKEVGQAEAAAGGLLVAADEKDPFRRGQENTFPGPSEITFREEVMLFATYNGPPNLGTQCTANVTYQYTRFTNLQTYSYLYNGLETSHHYTTGRQLSINQISFGLHDLITLIGHLLRGTPLVGNQAYLVANIFRAADDALLYPVAVGVLRDDGQMGDLVPNDGNYTLVMPAGQLPGPGVYDVYIFGFDVNPALETDPPLLAAQKIGGALISLPAAPPAPQCGLLPDFTISVGLGPPLCPGDCDCDGLVRFADIDYFVAAIPDNESGWRALYQARHGGAEPPCLFLNCDTTGDGHVNFADIDPFVALIPSACQ